MLLTVLAGSLTTTTDRSFRRPAHGDVKGTAIFGFAEYYGEDQRKDGMTNDDLPNWSTERSTKQVESPR